jgi:hypothetical protein
MLVRDCSGTGRCARCNERRSVAGDIEGLAQLLDSVSVRRYDRFSALASRVRKHDLNAIFKGIVEASRIDDETSHQITSNLRLVLRRIKTFQELEAIIELEAIA